MERYDRTILLKNYKKLLENKYDIKFIRYGENYSEIIQKKWDMRKLNRKLKNKLQTKNKTEKRSKI